MPVPVENIGSANDHVRHGSVAQRVVDFLSSTKGQAWRPVEISAKLGIPQTSLSTSLARLVRKQLIEAEKGHYFIRAP